MVVEDDPYGRLRYDGGHQVPLKAMDDSVIYLGTISKMLGPGKHRIGIHIVRQRNPEKHAAGRMRPGGLGGKELVEGRQHGVAALLVQRDELLQRALPRDIGKVVVTTGAQQALTLIAEAFIDPDDIIITEGPTYLGALLQGAQCDEVIGKVYCNTGQTVPLREPFRRTYKRGIGGASGVRSLQIDDQMLQRVRQRRAGEHLGKGGRNPATTTAAQSPTRPMPRRPPTPRTKLTTVPRLAHRRRKRGSQPANR